MFNMVLGLHVISAVTSIGSLGVLLFKSDSSLLRMAIYSSHALTFISGFSLFFLGSSLERVCSSLFAYGMLAGGLLVLRKYSKSTGCPYLDALEK
jgi:hypothetical protein